MTVCASKEFFAQNVSTIIDNFKAFETLVANVLENELLVGSVRADFRQSQHDVHLLSSTIVHVKHEAEMGNTHLQQAFAIKFGKYWRAY